MPAWPMPVAPRDRLRSTAAMSSALGGCADRLATTLGTGRGPASGQDRHAVILRLACRDQLPSRHRHRAIIFGLC